MTKEEFDKARLVYENEKRKLEETSLKLDREFADVSKEYLKNLITLDVGEFYVIDLTFAYNQRIYFKWTDSCKIEYRKEINEIELWIDEIISIHNKDVSIHTNYNYLSSFDRIVKNLGKVNLSVIKDAITYIKRKLEPYEISCSKEIKENGNGY